MSSLLAALSFFTFIPIPGKRITPQLNGWSLGLAPLTGLVVGAGVVGLDALIEPVFSHPLRDGLVVLLWIVLTGATHIDGLADSRIFCCAWRL